LAVTFLTTEDAQAINQQVSNLVVAIRELNEKIQAMDDNKEAIFELNTRTAYYESDKYKAKIIKEYKKKWPLVHS
jgi:hypothetical protein